MSDYSDLRRLAEASRVANHDERGADEAFQEAAHPEVILALISENQSLKGSCKALGEKTVRRKMQQLDRLKKENAQLRESIAVKEEFKSNADRFGESMEKQRDELLHALEYMLAYQYDGDPRRQADCDMCAKASAAIARAKGESA